MAFDKVCKLVKRPPVLAGMDRMQPEIRTLVTELLSRFAEGREDPLPAAQEGAAMALWGTHGDAETFLDWHRERGLAAALEVVLAAVAYEQVTYEWDGSIWALRRARPAAGFANLGPHPWVWMREQVVKAKPA
jgi:hypothetical protein